MKNLDQARKLVLEYQPTAAEASSWEKTKKNQLAIIDLQQVYAYQILVDTYGDIPYTQSLDVDKYPLPKYDQGKDIYEDLIKRAKADVFRILMLLELVLGQGINSILEMLRNGKNLEILYC